MEFSRQKADNPAAVEALRRDPVFSWFYEISQIPHGSGNEKALGQYLFERAAKMGISASIDDYGNVLLKKDASPGREDAPPILLQAHLDMVCEKTAGIDHDFAADPIQWVIDGDFLSTGQRTTLGADDGIGVAMAMAVLEDQHLSHPALEVLFTTNEEEDMSGALNFDTSALRAGYMINLDHVKDDEILCGSCGGMEADIYIPVISEPPAEGSIPCRIGILGLKGGHSGEDIHRGRGNANILMARLLMDLSDHLDLEIGPMRGGTFRLAIPRDAETIVWIPPAQIKTAKERISLMLDLFRAELPDTAGNLQISFRQMERSELSQKDLWAVRPDRVVTAMVLMPDGIFQMNEAFPGIVDTSDNLGEVYLDAHTLHFVTEIRCARESRGEYLLARMCRLAELFGGTCHASNAYPSWYYRSESPLRDICTASYRDCFGDDPRYLLVHAGLEVGCLSRSMPALDAISIGPNCRDFHSPSETLQISSVHKTYQFLTSVLERI